MTITDLVKWFSKRGEALCCDASLLWESERRSADRDVDAYGNIYNLEDAVRAIRENAAQHLVECGWSANRSDGKIDVKTIKEATDNHRRRYAHLAMEALAMLKMLDDMDPTRTQPDYTVAPCNWSEKPCEGGKSIELNAAGDEHLPSPPESEPEK